MFDLLWRTMRLGVSMADLNSYVRYTHESKGSKATAKLGAVAFACVGGVEAGQCGFLVHLTRVAIQGVTALALGSVSMVSDRPEGASIHTFRSELDTTVRNKVYQSADSLVR